MKAIILVLIFFSFNSLAQSRFLKVCPSIKHLDALKSFFKAKDCSEISIHLKEIKSFSDFIRINKKRKWNTKILSYPWTDDFPHLYGINRKILENEYSFESNHKSPGDDYGPLENFGEFENITHLTYTPEYSYYKGTYKICDIIKSLPYLKTITVRSEVLQNPFSDNCIKSSMLDGVIIQGRFSGFKTLKPKSKIIGIEHFSGNFSKLSEFEDLKYLGVSNKTNSLKGIEAIYKLGRLTHFSMNTSHSVKDTYKLGFLSNLEYLNLTCVANEQVNSPVVDPCKDGLSDISFLSNLIWLKHLNLSSNNIYNIEPINTLEELQYLKLRGNKIEKLPNLSMLTQLKYLDLSGNNLSNIQNITTLKSLLFLNISGNNVHDLRGLSSLNNLKFLNASNLTGKKKPLFMPIPSLKVLNISGAGGISPQQILENQEERSPFEGFENEHELFLETTIHVYDAKWGSCETKSNSIVTIDLDHFKNLEVLIMKNNKAERIENLTSLKTLKYLDLQFNSLKEINGEDLPMNLVKLNVSYNNLDSLPNLEKQNKLKYVNFRFNNITNLSYAKNLSTNIISLDLSSNRISSILDLLLFEPEKNHYSWIDLMGNYIPPTREYCPTDGEHRLNKECMRYIKGTSSAMKYSFYIPNETIESQISIHNEFKCLSIKTAQPSKKSFLDQIKLLIFEAKERY